MSINAIVSDVIYDAATGTAELILSPASRDPAGQPSLTVIGPPPHLDAMIGTHIWGGCSTIMVGDRKVADRLGYTKIRFTASRPAPPEPGRIHLRCDRCGKVELDVPRRIGDLKSAAWRVQDCDDCAETGKEAVPEYYTIEDHRVYYAPKR